MTGTIHCSVLDTPRRPGLHHHDVGPVVEDPWPRRRFADPGRRALPRQRSRLGRFDRASARQPAEPLELPDRRRDEARPASQGRDHGGLQANRRAPASATRSGGRADGKTTFNVSFYAVSKDGKFAGGCIYPGGKMAVHDGEVGPNRDVRPALREVIGGSGHSFRRGRFERKPDVVSLQEHDTGLAAAAGNTQLESRRSILVGGDDFAALAA